jgi:uncharacterized protein
MTLKRLILSILTVIAIAFIGLSLAQSWNQPQIQSRLELYQTNLLLHASEWQGSDADNADLKTASNKLIGDNPLKTALQQYQEARQSAQTTLKKLQAQASTPTRSLPSETQPKVAPVTEEPPPAQTRRLRQAPLTQIQQLIDELDLRIGILQAHQGETETALKTWDQFIREQNTQTIALVETAEALSGLWSTPPRLLPNAESVIKANLDGWFRYQALSRLYELQQRSSSLEDLQATEQAIAQQATTKLALVAGIPAIGALIGTVLLLGGTMQWLRQWLRQKNVELVDTAPEPQSAQWVTRWGGETIWQVLVLFFVGQFSVGQILLPLGLGLIGLNPAAFGSRAQAFYILVVYALLVTMGLLVLYLSLRPFAPLPEGWFRLKLKGNWFWWGLGGYFMALPLVIVVSLINQQFWQGQGGSNPILPIVLEGRDNVALFIFFVTASIAAPLFEEVMFRGFLLPSLTRYLPAWGAIAVSALLFAIAHLSLSEILPLMVLGMVLGYVYTRSRNLLAPMLLHSLWNSGTLVSLFILGSGSL